MLTNKTQMPDFQTRWETIKGNKFAKISALKEFLKALEEDGGDESLITEVSAKIRQTRKVYRNKDVRFCKVLGGSISAFAKPSVGKLLELEEANINTIVTLLQEKEGLEHIKLHAENKHIDWIWVPLSAGKLNQGNEVEILEAYKEIIAKLGSGENIFVHCAAGVHRTGLFIYGLLLKLGFDFTQARELIYTIRPVTAIEMVGKHWKWIERVVDEGK